MTQQQTDPRGSAPTYRGRRLPRPAEEVVDQGLGFDVETLLSRRNVLRAFGLGAAGLTLAACGEDGSGTAAASSTTTDGEIPEETAGPYPGDGSNGADVLEQSGVVRSDLRRSFGDASGTAHGVPMRLELTITDLADGGTPFTGVAVYVWHCDRAGEYSMYSANVEDQNYLRGVQVADADGVVRFTSIVPACYDGRWPHVHFEVYPDRASITDTANLLATSQLALPESLAEAVYAVGGYEESVSNLAAVSLETDGVFSDGTDLQLPETSGDVEAGYTLRLTVGVDTTTTPGGGGGDLGGALPAGGTPPDLATSR